MLVIIFIVPKLASSLAVSLWVSQFCSLNLSFLI